jgi:putative DNA primase/helicase
MAVGDMSSGVGAVARVLEEAEVFDPSNDLSARDVRESEDQRYKTADKLSWLPHNDYGNAKRLLHHSDGKLIFVRDNGWFAYDGQRWDGARGEHLARACAHDSVLAMRDELSAIKSKSGMGVPGIEDRIKAKQSWISQSGNSNKISAMLREMETMAMADIDDFDQHDMSLNVKNGTLWFDRGMVDIELRPHSRDDLITKCCDVEYDPLAKAPLWDEFLEQIMQTQEKRDFLQRWMGYSILGDVSEQVLTLFQGRGSNGKSVLVDVIHGLVGDYALTLPFESLLHDSNRSGGGPTPDMALLPGRRFVVASEPETGARLSESRVKSLTGGEEVIARHLQKGFFSFDPQAKFTLSFNNKPLIRGQDNGIWRRLLLLEFKHILPREKRDKHLKKKLAAERAGILNWLIAGALDWMAEGLKVPEEVDGATNAYKMESNPVASFAESCLDEHEGQHVRASVVRKVYEGWCRDNGVDPMKSNPFGRMLTERGAKREKIGGVVYYTNTCLTAYGDGFNGDGTDLKDE